jgi:hypothetical protein
VIQVIARVLVVVKKQTLGTALSVGRSVALAERHRKNFFWGDPPARGMRAAFGRAVSMFVPLPGTYHSARVTLLHPKSRNPGAPWGPRAYGTCPRSPSAKSGLKA